MTEQSNNSKPQRQSDSYRDPSGQVYTYDNRILRTVTEYGFPDYQFVRKTSFINTLISQNKLLSETEIQDETLRQSLGMPAVVLEHPKLPFISYPFEWSFHFLKQAALLFCDIHLEALEQGITLSDASAYNIQFQQGKPVYIDHLSFKRYQDGDIWVGHRQFCEQFLNPLLLSAYCGVPFNEWYNGARAGISPIELNKLLPWYRKIKPSTYMHVTMFSKLQQPYSIHASKIEKPKISLNGFKGILSGMQNWISQLEPKVSGPTIWQDYVSNRNYDDSEVSAKVKFVEEYVRGSGVCTLWDMGCNTGEFSALALEAGAKHVIGFEFDSGALESAARRATANSLDFLPLHMNLMNLTADSGWAFREYRSVLSRGLPDGILCLAIVHHLAITNNVPLPEVIGFITSLAKSGVIEFVPKQDRCVELLLHLREDIFIDYTQEAFEQALRQHAAIKKQQVISKEGRVLYWYEVV